MNRFDFHAHELLWAFERERVDRANRLRAALQLPWRGRWVRVRTASNALGSPGGAGLNAPEPRGTNPRLPWRRRHPAAVS